MCIHSMSRSNTHPTRSRPSTLCAVRHTVEWRAAECHVSTRLARSSAVARVLRTKSLWLQVSMSHNDLSV